MKWGISLQTKWSLSEYENPKRYDIENKKFIRFSVFTIMGTKATYTK